MQDTPSHAVSFEALYETYRAPVLFFLKRRCAAHADAEDLTEAIFEYIYRNYDKYDPEKASPRSWVFMIAVSRWKNYCRDRGVRAQIEGSEIPELPVEDDMLRAVRLDELRNDIAGCLEKLSKRQAQAVVLRYFKNMPYEQIAQLLGCTEQNARSTLSAALKNMKKYMPNRGDFS